MTRAIVFLMTLMFVLPSDGSSQAVPSPGDRIRIRQVVAEEFQLPFFKRVHLSIRDQLT